MQDQPCPRLFWYQHHEWQAIEPFVMETHHEETISESGLHPKLMQFLSYGLDLYCLRIDEKHSKK
ncbi:hypothetical protein C7N83_04290 [Neisseria iguanae]|uniref:Uncharacterized protein n=1 Tax=Neisseria iguanae TaxID=90242 RepID=A0A2P7U1G6_9NEIS|nr:hypothetical protein C7N83_04290 [Neisseria iguanae]